MAGLAQVVNATTSWAEWDGNAGGGTDERPQARVSA